MLQNNEVSSPLHYQSKSGEMEVIDVIEAFEPHPHIANCIKYLLRLGKKGDWKTDIRKTIAYAVRYYMFNIGAEREHMKEITETITQILEAELKELN